MLQRRIVRVQLLQLSQQNLYVLQLTAFLPVIDQQDPRLAVGRVALDDFLQLFLRRFQLLRTVQGGCKVVAVVLVIGFQFDSTSARFRTHILGNFGAAKKTGQTYGTLTTLTPPTTFTTDLGPIADTY